MYTCLSVFCSWPENNWDLQFTSDSRQVSSSGWCCERWGTTRNWSKLHQIWEQGSPEERGKQFGISTRDWFSYWDKILWIILMRHVWCLLQICSNWHNFYDPQSGIAMYMVGVGSSPNDTDVANLTRFSSKSHVACVELKPDRYLQHNQKYFTTVYAYNGGHKQQNVSAISNGGMISLILLCSFIERLNRPLGYWYVLFVLQF